ncbi:MAG TPA: hypothetical protein VF613_17885 [Longimicrobium sp.]|jgi:hypothetical protein
MTNLCVRKVIRTLVAGAAVALSASPRLHAQEAPPLARTAGYVELLGNGLIYSVNVDHRFTERVSGRVGLAAFGGAAVPVMANYLTGSGSHHLEAGAGALFIYIPEDRGPEDELEQAGSGGVLGTATLGYRYQPRAGGFVFRIGFTPIFGTKGVLPWAGVSLGFAP